MTLLVKKVKSSQNCPKLVGPNDTSRTSHISLCKQTAGLVYMGLFQFHWGVGIEFVRKREFKRSKCAFFNEKLKKSHTYAINVDFKTREITFDTF